MNGAGSEGFNRECARMEAKVNRPKGPVHISLGFRPRNRESNMIPARFMRPALFGRARAPRRRIMFPIAEKRGRTAFAPALQITPARVVLRRVALWSAPAERSGDGAFRAHKSATSADHVSDRGNRGRTAFPPALQITPARVVLRRVALWSAPAERSGDGAFRARKSATSADHVSDRGKRGRTAFAPALQITPARVVLRRVALWSAPAERSGDGAFRAHKSATPADHVSDRGKAGSHCVCPRAP